MKCGEEKRFALLLYAVSGLAADPKGIRKGSGHVTQVGLLRRQLGITWVLLKRVGH